MGAIVLKKIFVVEDSKFDRVKIKEIIDELKYKTDYFASAEAVMKKIKSSKESDLPDLMIIDIILAGKIDGYQLAQQIKEIYNLPIIFLTGKTETKKNNQQLLLGDLFLNKPINTNELKNNIEIIIKKNKLEEVMEEKLNKDIVNSLEHQIWYYKDPYTYKMVNENYAKFLGKSKKDFVDKKILNIFSPTEAEEIIVENIELFIKKENIKKEKWYKNASGESRLLSIKKTAKLNYKGQVESIFCQAEDITEKNILENELRTNRDNLQRIIETIPDMIFLININGDILDFWTGDQSKLIYTKEEIVDRNLKELLSASAFEVYQEKRKTLYNQNKVVSFEYSLVVKGEEKFYEAKMINLKSSAQLPKIIVSVRDISERKKSNLKLKELSKEYEIILSNVENAIFLINVEDNKFKFQRLNDFHEKATGLKTEQVKGKETIEIFGKEIGFELEANYRRCLRNKSVITYEEELDLPAGKKVWLTKLTPVINNGKVEKIVGSSLDITENKRKEKEIEYLSFHDEMTGLYNRRYFENEMKRLESSRKLPITVIIADLDNLKSVNDNFGHQVGDKYIKNASKMINDSIRDEDIAARIGGDEFAIILTETDYEGAEKIYQRIKTAEKKYLEQDSAIDVFSISIGYAVKNKENLKLEKIFKKADQKMYLNKKKK